MQRTFATPNTGYFGGGLPRANPFSTVDRIDYSNDTATAAEKGPLSNGRNQLAATGNQSFGYFGGGESPSGRVSTVDRIDYLNDTANALTKGPLSAAKSGVTQQVILPLVTLVVVFLLLILPYQQ